MGLIPNGLDSHRMAEMMEMAIMKRQVLVDEGPREHDDWWFSPTAYIVKIAVLGGIFLIFVTWIVGGYFHARARVRKGKEPLAYHRWLLPRTMHPGFQPGYAMPYRVNQYPEAPPIYDPNNAPPVYMSLDGKPALSQGNYPAPPPPASMR